MRILLIFLAISVLSILANSDTAPPLWPDTFSQDYIITDNSAKPYTTGKIWYDIKNDRQRVDVSNSWFDYKCNIISPNANTSCVNMNVNGALYYWLPQKNQCCKCCLAINGCGPRPKDWLKYYVYGGSEPISGQNFDLWKVANPRITEKYYATTDQKRIPRRMVDGDLFYDYVVSSYSQNKIAQSVFQLPQNCQGKCPSQTFCAQIDEEQPKLNLNLIL